MKQVVRRIATIACAIALSAVAAGTAHAQTREQHLARVVATERAFSKLSIDSAAQKAFDRYLWHEALVFRPRAVKAAEARARAPLPPSLALLWEPEWADVSRDGDLGYTTGPWISGPRNNAQADPKFGQYLTVWKRQPDGKYLALLDAGVVTPASAQGPRPLRSPGAPGYTRRAQPAADRASLMRADNDFTAASKKNGYAPALKPIGESEIRLLRNGTYPSMKLDSVALAMKGARVTWWVPVEAVTAASGDLGYTRGTYVIVTLDNKRHSGDYVRMWKRDARGVWRIAVDMLLSA